MKLCSTVIIFCVVLGFCTFLFAQGGMPKMQISKRDPLGSWKGIAPVSFKGRITDSQTGKPIKIFVICEIVNGVPETGQLESKGKVIDLGPQTIKTENGTYRFTLHIATLSGQTYFRGLKRYHVLGPGSESTIIQISSEGYENKNITIAKDKVLTGEDNHLDVILDPTE